jgi:dihydroneopterin aldolase
MFDVIEVPRISIMTRVGLTEAERARPQPIEIGLRLEVAIERGLGDDLNQTFDYSVLDRVIPEALDPAPKLLETIAERITRGIVQKADCSRVSLIQVTITKCRPPLQLETDGVKVTMRTPVRHGMVAAGS